MLDCRASERSTPNGEENPLIPMGAITGTPTQEFLYKLLKNWRSRGITQFMIYPRSGLELEHMSEAWLDRCEWICEDAQALGFTSIWLYDERNWPSGTCNGEVLKRDPDAPEFHQCIREWPICSIRTRSIPSSVSPMNATKSGWAGFSAL